MPMRAHRGRARARRAMHRSSVLLVPPSAEVARIESLEMTWNRRAAADFAPTSDAARPPVLRRGRVAGALGALARRMPNLRRHFLRRRTHGSTAAQYGRGREPASAGGA